jgi:hypothetical protein
MGNSDLVAHVDVFHVHAYARVLAAVGGLGYVVALDAYVLSKVDDSAGRTMAPVPVPCIV